MVLVCGTTVIFVSRISCVFHILECKQTNNSRIISFLDLFRNSHKIGPVRLLVRDKEIQFILQKRITVRIVPVRYARMSNVMFGIMNTVQSRF